MESEARRRSRGPWSAPRRRLTVPSKGMPKRTSRASGREARQAMKRGSAGINPLGGGLRPPSEPSPQDAVRAAGRPRAGPRASEASNPRLRRQSRRSKAEHFHVGRRATDEDSHAPALNVPVRARALPAQPVPGGGFGGGRRGPLRQNAADGPLSSL